MSTPDDDLRRALDDAVRDVHPGDALEQIRRRTAAPGPRRASGPLVVLGAVAATAAVIALAWGAGVLPGADDPEPPVAGTTTPATPSAAPRTGAGQVPGTALSAGALAVYCTVGTGGPEDPIRLVREFRTSPTEDRLTAAVRALSEAPLDPNYSTAVVPEAFGAVSRDGDTVRIALTREYWQELPTGVINAEQARIAVAQVQRTLRAATQEPDLQVEWTWQGRTTTVFGQDPTEVAATGNLALLNHVNLTTPEQDARVGDLLRVSGVGNAPEAAYTWKITAEQSPDRVLLEGTGTMEGYLGDRLFPFSQEIDVSALDPGRHTLTVTVTDDSGGEGGGPPQMYDDKQFTIK